MALASGCLITEVPEKEDPTRGRPQLVNPEPPPTEFLRIIAPNDSKTPVSLQAFVLSEDAGDDLQPFLLIDYGVIPEGVDPLTTDPYLRAHNVSSIPAATLDAGPRAVNAVWDVEPQFLDSTPGDGAAGCHSVTLMITHQPRLERPGYECPKDPNDYDSITWYATICTAPDLCTFDCPFRDAETFSYCEALTP